jgi:hypothetical protein
MFDLKEWLVPSVLPKTAASLVLVFLALRLVAAVQNSATRHYEQLNKQREARRTGPPPPTEIE